MAGGRRAHELLGEGDGHVLSGARTGGERQTPLTLHEAHQALAAHQHGHLDLVAGVRAEGRFPALEGGEGAEVGVAAVGPNGVLFLELLGHALQGGGAPPEGMENDAVEGVASAAPVRQHAVELQRDDGLAEPACLELPDFPVDVQGEDRAQRSRGDDLADPGRHLRPAGQRCVQAAVHDGRRQDRGFHHALQRDGLGGGQQEGSAAAGVQPEAKT